MASLKTLGIFLGKGSPNTTMPSAKRNKQSSLRSTKQSNGNVHLMLQQHRINDEQPPIGMQWNRQPERAQDRSAWIIL